MRKTYIDKMAEASQLYTIQHAEDPATFSLATEEDLPGIYDVFVSLWGPTNATTTETRLSWRTINPKMDYVVKQENIVVGFVNVNPLTHEAIQKYINREIQVKDLQPNDILPFTPGIALECEADIAVRAGVQEPKKYGMRLIRGIINVMRQFAKEGIIIKAIYTRSSTSDGIRLANGLGFKTVNSDVEQNSKLFVLDFETSDSPFAQEYNQIRAETR